MRVDCCGRMRGAGFRDTRVEQLMGPDSMSGYEDKLQKINRLTRINRLLKCSSVPSPAILNPASYLGSLNFCWIEDGRRRIVDVA